MKEEWRPVRNVKGRREEETDGERSADTHLEPFQSRESMP